MNEICNNLFIGNQLDYETKIKFENDWIVIHACKEPYHRQTIGYSGRGAPKGHPEYLIAVRGNRLILNLVDADDYKFIPMEIIEKALSYIDNNIKDKKIFVHCNQGESRAPSIGLIYMIKNKLLNVSSLEDAVIDFKKIYPYYNPAKGMIDFIRINWKYFLNE